MSVISERMQQRGTPLRPEGLWACGPCPKCGGTDRFRVIFNKDKGREFYTCRQCGAKGDDIQFLREFEGMSFLEAKALAERERGTSVEQPAPMVENEELWFDTLAGFVYRCQDNLFSSEHTLRSLEEKRGIRPETAERFKLGWNPETIWMPRDDLGLRPRYKDNVQAMNVCLAKGITIPVLRGTDMLCGLQIRRYQTYQGSRYMTVPGSQLAPMIFEGDDARIIVIVESYLCGMLVWQELGGRVTVVALGSAGNIPKDDTTRLIKKAENVLVALDSDEAGAAKSWRYWLKTYPHATRCPIPEEYGKDPTEGWLSGLDLSEWIDAGLSLAREDNGNEVPHDNPEPESSCLGSYSAKITVIEKADDARKAARCIAENCRAIGVAVDVEAHPAHAQHPQAGKHPKLSRVPRVAVYANDIDEVFVFRMQGIKRQDLRALWTLPVVVHDGVELMRHFALLRKGKAEVACTLLMANAVTNNRLTLEEALRRFTECSKLPESEDPEEMLAYRALALADLYPRLCEKATKSKLNKLSRLLRDAQRAVAAMEVDGVCFDVEAHSALCVSWAAEVAEHRACLPKDLNPESTKAVREWIIKVVPSDRRRGWQRTSTGELSTGDKNLALVDDIPQVHALREYRRLGKLLSTYGEAFAAHVNPVTGRLHADWLLGGMVTGRTAACTPNLQALPRDPAFRALFAAPEGHKLLVADVSQFQLRIAAHVADDEVMLRAYAEGLDLHTATAAVLAGVDVADVSKDQRRLAKAANFGLLFGQGLDGFRKYTARKYQVELSERDAKRIWEKWFRRFAGIARWHEETMEVLQDGYVVETVSGRVPGRKDLSGHTLQQALAFQIQGAEAEIMQKALATLHPVLQEYHAHLVNFVHDEVVLEVPEDDDAIAAVSAAVERSISDAFQHFFPDVTIEGLVDVQVVDNWAEVR